MSAMSLGELGKQSDYVETYTPSLLHGISRESTRGAALIDGALFQGEDLWTGYEFSWLNGRGMPQVAGLRLRVPAQSPMLVESKSMKLYTMSFSQTRFDSRTEVLKTLDQDLSTAFRAPVMVELLDLGQLEGMTHTLPGRSLDDMDVRINNYERAPDLLVPAESDVQVRETLHTHLFRSVCPVTNQPDWASLVIEYSGRPMNAEGLIRYLVSYRRHPGFHETTIEQIFCDLMAVYHPQALTVYGRFQRRGGLDINPFRSTHETAAPVYRLARQ